MKGPASTRPHPIVGAMIAAALRCCTSHAFADKPSVASTSCSRFASDHVPGMDNAQVKLSVTVFSAGCQTPYVLAVSATNEITSYTWNAIASASAGSIPLEPEPCRTPRSVAHDFSYKVAGWGKQKLPNGARKVFVFAESGRSTADGALTLWDRTSRHRKMARLDANRLPVSSGVAVLARRDAVSP